MAVMMPRQNWTDERLDHFEKSVNERFDRVDQRFDRVDERFKLVDKRFDQIDKRFDQIDKRLERMEGAVLRQNTTIVTGFIGLAGLIASNAIFF
jgi:DNA anti-recombination protein RmuC